MNRGYTYERLNENSKAIADYKNAALLYKKNGDTTWFKIANARFRLLEGGGVLGTDWQERTFCVSTI